MQPLRNTETLSCGMQFPLCPKSIYVETPSRILHTIFVGAYLKEASNTHLRKNITSTSLQHTVFKGGATPCRRTRLKEFISMPDGHAFF